MTLPNFLVIGTMKGGTTALWRYLRDHSEVFMADPKEIQFFSRNWHEGWDWYEAKFVGAGRAAAVGEASPSYAEFGHFPEVPKRIASRLPDVRLIYLVRHPVERVASQYLHLLTQGLEEHSMEEAVHSRAGYLGMNEYATVIEGYLEHFPRRQLLVLQSEALRDDRQATVRRVLEFLGVDPEEQSRTTGREYYRADQKPLPLKRTAVLAQAGFPGRARRLFAAGPTLAGVARAEVPRPGRRPPRPAGRDRRRRPPPDPTDAPVPRRILRRLGHRVTTESSWGRLAGHGADIGRAPRRVVRRVTLPLRRRRPPKPVAARLAPRPAPGDRLRRAWGRGRGPLSPV